MSRLAICAILILLFPFAGPSAAQETAAPAEAKQTKEAPKRMTPELLAKLGRVGGGVVSKDGKKIAYTVRNYKLEENKGYSDLHILDLTNSTDTVLLEAWPSVGALQWGE